MGVILPVVFAVNFSVIMNCLFADVGKRTAVIAGVLFLVVVSGCCWSWSRPYKRVEAYDLANEIAFDLDDQEYSDAFAALNSGRHEAI